MLIVLVGLPRSGKTTWARQQTESPIVSPDAIRLALHGHAFIPSAEPFVWATAGLMVTSLFKAGHEEVIIDACNTTRKRRDVWSRFSKDSEGSIGGFLYRQIGEFNKKRQPTSANLDLCLKRAKDGDRDDLIPVIERMYQNFEPIEDDELL